MREWAGAMHFSERACDANCDPLTWNGVSLSGSRCIRTSYCAWYDSKAMHTSMLRLASVGVLGVLGCVGTNKKAALFTAVAGYKQSRVMVVGIAWTATQHTPAACQ